MKNSLLIHANVGLFSFPVYNTFLFQYIYYKAYKIFTPLVNILAKNSLIALKFPERIRDSGAMTSYKTIRHSRMR